jgi:hypothetical protein
MAARHAQTDVKAVLTQQPSKSLLRWFVVETFALTGSLLPWAGHR